MGQAVLGAAAAAVVFSCAVVVLRFLNWREWFSRPYVATPRYKYGEGMERADKHLLNRIGKRRFDEIVVAQQRHTGAERLTRRLALVRKRGAA